MNPGFDITRFDTPYYIVDENKLVRNLTILKEVADRSGCKILLAQKAFSLFAFYPLIGQFLHGTTASGLYEAMLSHEEMKKENHIFSAAYRPDEFDAVCRICDHIVFNSFSQYEAYRERALYYGRSIGIRINPACSTQKNPLYDPCAPGSRLGVVAERFPAVLPKDIEGLHFHTLCEQNADALLQTLRVVKERFGRHLSCVKWVNFGGGHHITRDDYDREALIAAIRDFRTQYGVEVYLEPGEAVALNSGYLVSSVLDIVENGIATAILDTSAACHMPDVLEVPYRPEILNAALPGEKPFSYRLGGLTCLAGDIIGEYSFDAPLRPADRLVFCDMAHYTMVKNNTFNGIGLPSIAVAEQSGRLRLIKSFGYLDVKGRLS